MIEINITIKIKGENEGALKFTVNAVVSKKIYITASYDLLYLFCCINVNDKDNELTFQGDPCIGIPVVCMEDYRVARDSPQTDDTCRDDTEERKVTLKG